MGQMWKMVGWMLQRWSKEFAISAIFSRWLKL